MSAPSRDVADRLERLATHAPRATADPDGLWRRGRWSQRRRVASVVAGIAATGVLASAMTPTVLAGIDRPVAASPSVMVLPDELRTPGGWEPAFPPTPGRLSAVGVGQRSGWLSSAPWLWAVSAATGESRWLDLPDFVANSGIPPQLSADGRRLAYWVTGPISGEPVSAGPGAVRRGSEPGAPVVGVAVMDLETGEVARWDIASEHGLWAQGLRWAGDVLWWEGGPVIPMDGGASASTHTYTWDVTTDEKMEAGVRPGLSQTGDAPGGFVSLPRFFKLEQVTGSKAPESLRVDLPDDAPSSAGLIDPEMAPDGERVAALMLPYAPEFDDAADKDLVVGTKADGAISLQPVGGVRAQAVLGWRSPTVAVVASSRTSGEDGSPNPEGVQVSTADVTVLDFSKLLQVTGVMPSSFASEAWAGEVVTPPPTPFAPDPRLVGVGAVVVLAFGISLWRSVRRRRGHP